MKKLVKLMPIIVTIVMIFAILMPVVPVFAAGANPGDIKITDPSDSSGIQSVGGKIIGAVRMIGSVIAVLMIVVLGIKYMLGSSEEKAEYKKSMVPYLVGAVLLFGASQIAGAIYGVVNQA